MKTPLLPLFAAAVALTFAGCKKQATEPPPAADANATSAKAEAPKPPAEKFELKAKIPVGKRLLQRTTMEQVMTMNLPNLPQPMRIVSNLQQDVGLSVLAERPEGGHEVEVEFGAQKIETKSGEQVVMSFDSGQDPKEDAKFPAARALRKAVGAKVKLLTDASGQVQKVDNYQAFARKLTAGANAQSLAVMRQFYSEASLRQISLVSLAVPPQPVAIGETWKARKNVPGPMGAAAIEIDYVFKGWEEHEGRKCAVLEGNGVVNDGGAAAAPAQPEPAMNEGAMNPGGPEGPGAPEGAPGTPAATPAAAPGITLASTAWFDPEAGMVIEEIAKLTLGAQGTINMTNKIVEVSDLPAKP
jgi:hypothetical protein